jgi:hypothetical protein
MRFLDGHPMCGRYGRWSRHQRIEEILGIEPSGEDFPVLYNIATAVTKRNVKLFHRNRIAQCVPFYPGTQ